MARTKILSDRSQIIDVALKLIETEGLEAVSMRRLAKEMKVSSMTLYNYVQNANDVLREILISSFSDLYEQVYIETGRMIRNGVVGVVAYSKAYAMCLFDFAEGKKEICKYLIDKGFITFHKDAELFHLYRPFEQLMAGQNDSLSLSLELYENGIESLIYEKNMGIKSYGREKYEQIIDFYITKLLAGE